MKKLMYFLGFLAVLILPCISSAQVLNIGYGESTILNSTFGDTIRIDSSNRIRQKISGAFVVDSTTGITINLQSKGRHVGADIVELVFAQKILSATNGGDSVQVKFLVDYCWDAICVPNTGVADSTYRVTTSVTSIKDTTNNSISLRVPRSATSLVLHPRITGLVNCHACRAAILPKFVRGR